MSRAAYSNFLLSASYPELNSQVFLTNTTGFSAGCINNPNTTVIAVTSISTGWCVANKGSYAATLSFQPGQVNKNIGPFGFTIDPAPSNYNKINYGWLLQDDGTVGIMESGSNVGAVSAYTVSTVFKITYRNNSISYYIDDSLVREVQGIYSYMYTGFHNSLTDNNASLVNLSYQRYNLVNVQTAPFTVTFQPSSIDFEDQFVSKMVYAMPDRVVTRDFTFSTLQDALTGSTKNIDSRSNFSYTFFSAPSGNISYIVALSATLFPSLSTIQYTVQVPVEKPRLTRNPALSSADKFVFDSAHILKSKAWGPDNTVLFVVEGVNHDNTSQLFLLSSTQ